jgi:hypothetical protein
MNYFNLCLALASLSSHQLVSGDFEARENLRFDVKVVYNQAGVSTEGPFLTSPLGSNFDPRGEVVPQG